MSQSHSSCPCTFEEVEPCNDNCTCRTPYLSGGCACCCTYGSYEQRLQHAKRLSKLIRGEKVTQQDKVVHVLENMLKTAKTDSEYASRFGEILEEGLNLLLDDDVFGSEGQCDPRGDHRDGEVISLLGDDD